MSNHSFSSITNAAYGFRLDIPAGWTEIEPDLNNGPFEVAQFVRDKTDRLLGGISVFRVLSRTPQTVADGNQTHLEAGGFGNFVKSSVVLGDRNAVRLDFDKPVDANRHPGSTVRHHFVRQYYVPVTDAVMVLALNTPEPGRDGELLDRIAASFDVMEQGVGLVFLHSRETPTSFVTELLESTFGYTRSRAMRTAVNIDAHGESVVAVVEKTQADDIVSSILSRAREAGYPFKCRVSVQ